ncbi:MAG: hypothetical protein A2758_02610 [Candidatus Zambryskibacteria bacterium RIFCSPHIGHO2_01_FULL_49_18]|uniref:Plasmid stabilization protein n=2 Tax=Candidatus Zambryskiibacteriota TaxID=1817925 RepID=A0A1G2T210_9BACT|nr:MAG: hypothetical protein A2758_02610 [Candidatus Zambryskibacteria bacterium RIFCSPHIGHO2_01_FULL_49_18]OHB04969.1 MAG: hypothetical protein A3A26_00105 [Candidatus Zambryskibacteria bacterium RIFCSPLOWO2_01_FULL_47_14]
MIEVGYASEFVRLYSKLEPGLQSQVKQAISLFRHRSNHKKLRVHKLHGREDGKFAFYVNYKYRIIFEYLDRGNKRAALLQVGDHGIYK